MKITWIGVGGAFATRQQWNSMFLVTAKSGKNLLVDCGRDAQHALEDAGIGVMNLDKIDGVYISHLHGDHIGGLESFGFGRYFIFRNLPRPKLYIDASLVEDLWRSLQSGMESLQREVANLSTYFDVIPIEANSYFMWEDIVFNTVQSVHIVNGRKIMPSFGLHIKNGKKIIYWTSDTQFAPEQLVDFYEYADIVFHDMETIPYQFKSRVHAHYEDLKKLAPEVKSKMWGFHYGLQHNYDPKADGFAGLIQKGQVFEF